MRTVVANSAGVRGPQWFWKAEQYCPRSVLEKCCASVKTALRQRCIEAKLLQRGFDAVCVEACIEACIETFREGEFSVLIENWDLKCENRGLEERNNYLEMYESDNPEDDARDHR